MLSLREEDRQPQRKHNIAQPQNAGIIIQTQHLLRQVRQDANQNHRVLALYRGVQTRRNGPLRTYQDHLCTFSQDVGGKSMQNEGEGGVAEPNKEGLESTREQVKR